MDTGRTRLHVVGGLPCKPSGSPGGDPPTVRPEITPTWYEAGSLRDARRSLDAESTEGVSDRRERRGAGVLRAVPDLDKAGNHGWSREPGWEHQQPESRWVPGWNIDSSSRGNATLLSAPKTPWMRVNLSSADVASEKVASRNPLQEKMVGAVRFELTTF